MEGREIHRGFGGKTFAARISRVLEDVEAPGIGGEAWRKVTNEKI